MVEPILTAIATALAGKTATGLYELATNKFAEHCKAREALEAATQASHDPITVATLADHLADAERADPDFRDALRSGWVQLTSGDSVLNQ